MESEKRLYEAALKGDVTLLQELLENDALLLNRFTSTNFNETPLHIAAMCDHVEFAKLILDRNPQLSAELDFQKHSALHIASAKGHLEIVKVLVVVNPEMCLARDRHGRNPLHLAAIKGRVEVVKELIRIRPLAALENTVNGENILHVSVKHDQLEVLKVLMEVRKDIHDLLNARDGDGSTILHLAVVNKQIETIKYLVRNKKIEVNIKDGKGKTALDILGHSWRDMNDVQIGDHLGEAGGLRQDSAGNWLTKKRDAIMVVASLIATMAFQAGMNPPGGVWQEGDPKGPMPHKAGEAIMAYSHPKSYRYFIRVNTVAFVASLSTILLLISGLPFRRALFMWVLMVIMWLTVTSIALTYGISIYIVTPKKDREQLGQVIEIAVTVWCSVIAVLFLGNTFRLVYKWIKKKQHSRKSAKLPQVTSYEATV